LNDLINIAVVTMLLFGGTKSAEKIFISTREAALVKAAQGLPKMTPFTKPLTKKKNRTHY
jgi:hypothetical protein